METTKLRTDILLMKEWILKLQNNLEALHQGCVKQDEYVDREPNKQQFRLNLQRDDINEGQEMFKDLNEPHNSLAVESLLTSACVNSMWDRLCHCGTGDRTRAPEHLIPSPALSYEGSNASYHTQPPGVPTCLPARLIPLTEDIQVYKVPQEGWSEAEAVSDQEDKRLRVLRN